MKSGKNGKNPPTAVMSAFHKSMSGPLNEPAPENEWRMGRPAGAVSFFSSAY
jgi:hypothetical protein